MSFASQKRSKRQCAGISFAVAREGAAVELGPRRPPARRIPSRSVILYFVNTLSELFARFASRSPIWGRVVRLVDHGREGRVAAAAMLHLSVSLPFRPKSRPWTVYFPVARMLIGPLGLASLVLDRLEGGGRREEAPLEQIRILRRPRRRCSSRAGAPGTRCSSRTIRHRQRRSRRPPAPTGFEPRSRRRRRGSRTAPASPRCRHCSSRDWTRH